MLPFLKCYLRSFLVFCVILYVSLIRIAPVKLVSDLPYFDKLVHLGMYFCFAFFLYLDSVKKNKAFCVVSLAAISILIPSLLGGIIELLQSNFFPPRTAEWADFIADFLGSVLAFLLLHLYFSKTKKQAFNKIDL